MIKRVALAFLLALVVACKPAAKTETKLSATQGQVGPFVIPPSWKQAAWFLDGSNVSTCASDNNRTCSSSSCTSGDGPCLTFGSILSRWGTYEPLIQQKTTLTIMSSMVYPDTIYMQPRIQYLGTYPSANFIVSCNLPTATWSGAIGTVTAKNRATPQLLTANLSSFTGVVTNQLLVNATHPSEAWTYKVASGSVWDISQPVTGCDTAASFPCPTPLTEVDTWATSDVVSAYTPYTIYMASFEPVNQSDVATSSMVVNCKLDGYNPSPFVSYLPFRSNAGVVFSNDIETRLVEYATSGNYLQGSNSQVAPTFDNNAYLAYISGMFNPTFDAGIISATASIIPILSQRTLRG